MYVANICEKDQNVKAVSDNGKCTGLVLYRLQCEKCSILLLYRACCISTYAVAICPVLLGQIHFFVQKFLSGRISWICGNVQIFIAKFEVCKSVHHHTFQINQPTRCNNFSSLLRDVYVQLNMFRASSRPSSRAQQLQWQPLVLPLERGGSSAVGRVRACRPARPTTTNNTATTTLQW